MAKNVLANKDVNAAMAEPQVQNMDKDVKTMEYHRQVFQSKMAENETYAPPKPKPDADPRRNGNVSSKDPLTCCDRNNKYISPSDNIMSPCTAKINALRNKHASKFVISGYCYHLRNTLLTTSQSQAQVALRTSER